MTNSIDKLYQDAYSLVSCGFNMCGIFGYIGNKNNAPRTVLEGLKLLEYRGYDSWGIVYKNRKNLLKVIKRVGKIGDAKLSKASSRIALGHTRWATHGGVTVENAHPHTDCANTVAVVHNGIIENFQELRKDLERNNHKFTSETDTEIAAHKIEEYIKEGNSPIEATRKAFLDLSGRNAIIAFFPSSEELIIVKNGSPVVLGKGKEEYFVASDASALLPHTKKIFFLDDDSIVSVLRNKIKIIDMVSKKIKKIEWKKIKWTCQKAEKGKYKHYFLKEIMDQRLSLTEAITQNEKTVRNFAQLIRKSYGAYFVGAGTAYYACLSGVYIFSKIARRHINVVAASEFPYAQHFIRPDSLLIGISQSGETADVLEAVEAARNNGARVGAIVNVIGSTLSRVADRNLPLRAGPERAVLATKSFTSMLVILYLVAFTLIGEYKRGREILLNLADLVEKFLSDIQNLKHIESIAKAMTKKDHIYMLGRGLSYPIALEAALKIKESSYMHAEGFAGGELKHGVIALVEKEVPFLVFVPNDETRTDIISNIMEVKARGAYIIAVSPQKNDIYNEWIKVPDAGVANPIMSVIPAQLLAYYLTIGRGLDPDKPRNLAKSVTVK